MKLSWSDASATLRQERLGPDGGHAIAHAVRLASRAPAGHSGTPLFSQLAPRPFFLASPSAMAMAPRVPLLFIELKSQVPLRPRSCAWAREAASWLAGECA